MLSDRVRLLALVGILTGFVPAVADEPPRSNPASDAFFASRAIPQIRLHIEPDELAKLRVEPRSYAQASFREDGGTRFGDVGIKLKGAAGSFRDWQDRPALTLNMRKYHKKGAYHGLEKFHLNNSVQDETYLLELLSSDLFRTAGYPAPRVGHARVWLNGRDVGLYVLKEGFDEEFLKAWFTDPRGNLYDGGFCQDIDAALEKDEGAGPDDRSDLRAIVEAAHDPDPVSRCRRLANLVDMDAFCAFMAMERMVSHWDGYVDKANNYRLYFDPKRGKAVFLPHGMDQTFGDPNTALFNPSGRLVGSAVMQSPDFRRKYHDQVTRLIPLMAPADRLLSRVDEVDRRIKPVVEAMNRDQAAHRNAEVANLKTRLVARAVSLEAQLAGAKQLTPTFDAEGVARLADGWGQLLKSGPTVLDEVAAGTNGATYHIAARQGEPCDGSWRRHVFLDPGSYSLEVEVNTEQVVKWTGNDQSGVGVGISGVARDQHLSETVQRKRLTHPFEVGEGGRNVILVLELRAKSGQVWFDRQSLRLVRHGDTAPSSK